MKQSTVSARHGHRGRPFIGADSPCLSLTRSPASTLYCDLVEAERRKGFVHRGFCDRRDKARSMLRGWTVTPYRSLTRDARSAGRNEGSS
jgi:hypothetical protein